MKIALIRHFQTPGNQLGKYIGSTDEDLILPILFPEERNYPSVEKIYVSPLKRCIQTANEIYGNKKLYICTDFRECNFGAFENKNYQELSGDPRYQAWIDSNGTMPFPEGESPMAFRNRCKQAFLNCIKEAIVEERKTIAFVVHGGTIMSIMEAFDIEKKEFYDYQVKNGQGFYVSLEKIDLQQETCKLKCIRRI